MTNLSINRQENVNCDDQFLSDILFGLGQTQKSLPCKYFYDERGSVLFDEICKTEDYYHTRTELSILDEALPEVARLVGPDADILEFGSGAGIKIQKLIEALQAPRSYCPIDISEEILVSSSAKLKAMYPSLEVFPIVADYLSPIELPAAFTANSTGRKLVFFPGSTISNFDQPDAIQFLRHIRSLLSPGDALLIGVDLIKPETRLISAYDDREGITAAFNLNLLERIRNTYATDLNPGGFKHEVRYNSEKHRIEMHLSSRCDQVVNIEGERFEFVTGETIHTENSYKYSVEGFSLIASNLGFAPNRVFTDSDNLFSVHYLSAH